MRGLAFVIGLTGGVASDKSEVAKRFEAQNPDVKVVIDKVPYKAIVETLPLLFAASSTTSPVPGFGNRPLKMLTR